MVKKLILVTSPPACGKTYISKALAKRLQHVVYLDKDTLITLSKQIFVVAGQPYDRSSDFFEKNIRDYEYECVVDLAMEALDYDDIVLINAPFTQEIRDMDYIHNLKAKLAEKNAPNLSIFKFIHGIRTNVSCLNTNVKRNIGLLWNNIKINYEKGKQEI